MDYSTKRPDTKGFNLGAGLFMDRRHRGICIKWRDGITYCAKYEWRVFNIHAIGVHGILFPVSEGLSHSALR